MVPKLDQCYEYASKAQHFLLKPLLRLVIGQHMIR
jgi:hypothetical protein